MTERDLSDLDLRRMRDTGQSVTSDIVPGRWRVRTRLRRRPWALILEPDAGAHHLVVITAYPLGE